MAMTILLGQYDKIEEMEKIYAKNSDKQHISIGGNMICAEKREKIFYSEVHNLKD